ncbi:MAG TPA: tetratricopeptide repeat protein [Bacteroidia bacterium]|nr:tetratricopeptide repeat protein [Bacteroidia bacterium]
MRQIAGIGACLLFMLPLRTEQTGTPLQDAFSKSYTAEASGKYDDAIKALSSVCDDGSYECSLRLGWLSYEAKDYVKSIAYYQKAIDAKPYAIEARFGIVKPESALLKWDDVLGQYMEILKIDPQNTKANYWTGCIYYNRKDYKKAISYFEKVVNLYPFDYDSSIMLGWSYLNDGRSSDAKVMFGKVLLISPGDTSATGGLKKLN